MASDTPSPAHNRTASVARADIVQWEYVNPADPAQGKRPSLTLTPGGAGANAAPGANLANRDLTKAYLIGANLSALAVWDDREKSLLLARDPLGIKPLYLTKEGGCLRFASQVKALEAGGAISREIDPAGVAGFLLWGSVPEPLTIRKGVRALPPGHHLIVREGRTDEPVASGLPAVAAMEPAAAIEDSVRAHLVSDVPVAVFLSAGLDSSGRRSRTPSASTRGSAAATSETASRRRGAACCP
jgi:hypothetical protein